MMSLKGTDQLRVLLVEDEIADAILLQRALHPAEVVWVETLADGITKLATEKFDAIACDLNLPGTGFRETINTLIAAKPDSLPLIVLTGIDDDRLAEELISAGVQDYVCKDELNSKALARRFRMAARRANIRADEAARQLGIAEWARAGRYRWEWDLLKETFEPARRWAGVMGTQRDVAHDGTRWTDRVHPGDLPTTESAIASLRHGEIPGLELRQRMRIADGTYRWFRARITGLRDCGPNPIRLLGSHEDVTSECGNPCIRCGTDYEPSVRKCGVCRRPIMAPPGMADTLEGPAEGWGGRVVGERYRIERSIGAGAGGAVYLAFDKAEQRPVAMKFLHPWLLDSVDAVDRFKAEAASQAELTHPNIIRVYDVGEHKGHRYLALEHADAGSLSDALDERGPMAVRGALRLFIPLVRGVGAAHAAGIVHRDIKPSNVLLSRQGERIVAKLTDFGVAKWRERAGDTATGAVIGTAMYMAPEQFTASRKVDARADIYALGATLYQTLCGKLTKRPAWAGRPLAALHEVVPDAPKGVSFAIAKAMQMDPSKRFGTCEELASELESALRRPSVG